MLVVYTGSPANATGSSEPVAELAPAPNEPMVHGPADKFLGSGLDQILAAAHVQTVIVVGTSANAAVMYTASEAALRNMGVVVPVDGISGTTPFTEVYAIWHLKNATATVASHVVLTTINQITLQ
jgi:nicotinamidase-related amidase